MTAIKPLYRNLLVTIALIAVFFVVKQFTFPTTVVRYSCMVPGMSEGQRLLINRLVYNFHPPERGDVIIFEPPFDSVEPYIKRVIGLPGESVEMTDGAVYIHKDGHSQILEEPYVLEDATYTFNGDVIPEGEYFVLGDNRNNSHDSHTGWTVNEDDIMAKAWFSIWPLNRLGVVANPLQDAD